MNHTPTVYEWKVTDPTDVTTSTADIADKINAAHSQATAYANVALRHAIECGGLLAEVRATTAHGQWANWLSTNCPSISDRTERLYRRLYEHRNRITSSADPIATIGEATRLIANPSKKSNRQDHAEMVDPLTDEERAKLKRCEWEIRKSIASEKVYWAAMAEIREIYLRADETAEWQKFAELHSTDDAEIDEMLIESSNRQDHAEMVHPLTDEERAEWEDAKANIDRLNEPVRKYLEARQSYWAAMAEMRELHKQSDAADEWQKFIDQQGTDDAEIDEMIIESAKWKCDE